MDVKEVITKKEDRICFPRLYKKTEKRLDVYDIYVIEDKYYSEWGIDGGKKQVAEKQGIIKNKGRSNMKTPEDDALFQAFSNWKEVQKKKGYITDKIEVGEVVFPNPMLADTVEKRLALKTKPFTFQKTYFCQRKLDGHRCITGVNPETKCVEMRSRGMEKIMNISHIKDEIIKIFNEFEDYNDIYLDGELYCHGMPRQTIASMTRKKLDKHPDEKKISYHIYDCFVPSQPDMIYSDRLKIIEKIKEKNVFCVETDKSNNEEEMRNLFDDYVSKGYEGLMIRFPEGVYESTGKRSKHLLKMKQANEEDCLITGFFDGKGKHQGCIIFKLVFPNNQQEFNSVPKNSLSERTEMFNKGKDYIGKIAVVKYFSLSNDGIPEFANVIDIKDDGLKFVEK